MKAECLVFFLAALKGFDQVVQTDVEQVGKKVPLKGFLKVVE